MATHKDGRRITPETISFRQVARIAGWTSQPPFMIGFEDSVCSRRFPILIAPSRRHAQLLCDSLNDRYANQVMMPRFGWLPENDLPAHESVNIATSIRQARTGKLRGEAATAIHSIAKEAKAVDATVADLVGPDIVSCDGPQPDRFYVFVRLFPGLLMSSPWKEWVVLPDRDVESVMLSDARKWARENWDQVVAVFQKQSRLRMGAPSRREDEESEAVERLMAEALNGANRETIKAKPAKTAEPTSKSEQRAEWLANIKTKAPAAPVFSMPHRTEVAQMLRDDLAAARKLWLSEAKDDAQEYASRDESDFLAVANHDGERIDFHALRHTCGAWLAMVGEHPKVIQTVMRHGSITLTMDTYGHLFPGQEANAVGRMQSMLAGPPEALRATGTDHATAECPGTSAAPGAARRMRSRACWMRRRTKRERS